MNKDAKLLRIIFAEMIFLDKFIDDCQLGFMCSKYFGNNIHLVSSSCLCVLWKQVSIFSFDNEEGFYRMKTD